MHHRGALHAVGFNGFPGRDEFNSFPGRARAHARTHTGPSPTSHTAVLIVQKRPLWAS